MLMDHNTVCITAACLHLCCAFQSEKARLESEKAQQERDNRALHIKCAGLTEELNFIKEKHAALTQVLNPF